MHKTFLLIVIAISGLISGTDAFACNGLVYSKGNEAIVFDAPSNDSASVELINWVKNDLKKGLGARKGNLKDSHQEFWLETPGEAKHRYPNLKLAVPGHGEPSGKELLDCKINLFENK
jgi:hypothetical protein